MHKYRRRSRGTAATALALGLVLTLAGCGAPQPTKAEQANELLAPAEVDVSDGLVVDGEQIADAELYEAAQEHTVNFYSAAGMEAEELTVARFEEETGISVRLTRLPNNKLAERVMSEHGAGKLEADAIRLTDPRVADEFTDRGIYQSAETPFDGLLDEDARSDGWYTGYYFVNAIGYNSAVLADDPPTGWESLVDEDYSGKVGMVSITTGGTLNALYRFQLGTFGRDFLEEQAEMDPRVFDSTSTHVDALARGEVALGPVSFNNAFAAQVAGAPIRLVIPEEGVSASQGPLGLTENGVENPAAQVFLNWSMSSSGQRFVGSQGFVPARSDIGEVTAGEYTLPRAGTERLHLLDRDGFDQYAAEDEVIWKDVFDYIG